MQVARKISVSVMNGVRKGFKNVTETQYVGRIYGIARSAVVEEGQNGQYIKFTGEFRGVNPDGEVFAAPVAFLPAPADGMLAEAVKADEKGGGVQFGFDFFIEPREDVAIGYSYITKPLIENKPSDPLAALESQIAEPPRLGAPAEEKADKAPPAEEKADKAGKKGK